MDEGMRQATTSPPADKGREHGGLEDRPEQTGQKGATPLPAERAPSRTRKGQAEPARRATKGLAGAANLT
eukprot:2605864-Alexandrium_andersonii.AAC.1